MGVKQIFQIIGLVITYGPTVVKLAIQIYKTIEEYAKRKETDKAYVGYDGKKPESKDKAQRFDMLMKAHSEEAGKRLEWDDIEKIRETVVAYKNRKRTTPARFGG